jgi:hypothetical protein
MQDISENSHILLDAQQKFSSQEKDCLLGVQRRVV